MLQKRVFLSLHLSFVNLHAVLQMMSGLFQTVGEVLDGRVLNVTLLLQFYNSVL